MSNYLQQRLEINKKQLEVLDSEIKELKKLRFVNKLPTPEAAGVHPYFYSVMGADGLPGILIDNILNQPVQSGILPRTFFEGIISIHADAPFIWTHVASTIKLFRDATYVDTGGNIIQPNDPSSQYQSVVLPSSLNHDIVPGIATAIPAVNLGFIDSSSGRVFFQSEEQQAEVGGTETKGALTPGSVFDLMKNMGYLSNIDGAPGHGPCNFFELPAQTELPMNGTIRVQAQPGMFNPQLAGAFNGVISYRVMVSLVGYKILEG